MAEDLIGTYYEKEDMSYKCVGLITHPAVILENVKTKEQQIHVIGCRNYNEFTHFIKEKKK